MRWRWDRILPPVVAAVVIIAAGEVIVRGLRIPDSLLPAPSAVGSSLIRDHEVLLAATMQTAAAALTGFALSATLGVSLAVLLASSRWVQRAIYPYTVLFQTVPLIAIAPMMVIWLGLGYRTAAGSAFIASVFPVLANTLSGLLSTDPALRDLFRLYGANSRQRLFKLMLPFAMPNMFTGLRISAGLAVIGAIVGEFIGGGGIGLEVMVAQRNQRTATVFAAVVLASCLGMVMFWMVNLAAWLTLRRWHASEQGE